MKTGENTAVAHPGHGRHRSAKALLTAGIALVALTACAPDATPTAAPQLAETSPATPPSISPATQQSLPATMSLPAAGIAAAAITAFEPAEHLVEFVAYTDDATPDGTYMAVEPPAISDILWYDRTGSGTLSSDAGATARLYCHATRESQPGICQNIDDVIPGDTMTIDTPTEKLTYAATDEGAVVVPKADAQADDDFASEIPRTIRVITCNHVGSVAPDGHTIDNLYVSFVLTDAVAL